MNTRIVLPLSALLLTNCVSSTVIRSNPSGARVSSLSGAVLGKTPYVYEDTETIGHRERFRIEQDGYDPAELTIERRNWNQGRTIAFIIPGLFFLPFAVGLLWAQDYEPEYEVELAPAGQGGAKRTSQMAPDSAPTTL